MTVVLRSYWALNFSEPLFWPYVPTICTPLPKKVTKIRLSFVPSPFLVHRIGAGVMVFNRRRLNTHPMDTAAHRDSFPPLS
eukprot:scaffold26784_cov113-Cylindrotheca_fusiformis.AAC.2